MNGLAEDSFGQEQAVAKAIAAGTIGDAESLAATTTLQIPVLQLNVRFDGEVKLP